MKYDFKIYSTLSNSLLCLYNEFVQTETYLIFYYYLIIRIILSYHNRNLVSHQCLPVNYSFLPLPHYLGVFL